MTPDQPVPAHCPNCTSSEFTIEVPLGIWVCNECGYTTSGLPGQPESSEKVPDTCPRCGSHHPNLHPAMQLGGEVQICGDPWHNSVLKVPNTCECRHPDFYKDPRLHLCGNCGRPAKNAESAQQRQRDIEQLARELFVGYAVADDSECPGTLLTDDQALVMAFDSAEAFYAELDKRRAG